jgi:L-threonylcarbamoyladenylate synthase
MVEIFNFKNGINEYEINRAAEVIKNGGLVAFPTETIYGLGADALNEDAVKKIFYAKGRPADNPLIVHIADEKDLDKFVEFISEKAKKLINSFWPGPLTIVFKKKKIISDVVSAGLDSVAVRMPSNLIALELIRRSGKPIAAPSANSSGRPSPTIANHVIEDFGTKINVVIDGGKCDIGVESTVIDVSGQVPVVLRAGGISIEQIQEVLGEEVFYVKKLGSEIHRSPGMKYRHYAPNAKLILADKNEFENLIDNYKKQNKKIGVINFFENKNMDVDVILFAGVDCEEIAKNIFRILREMDDNKVDIILSERIEEKGLGLAIMDKLRRASED